MLESHLKSFELNSIFAAQITLFPPQLGVSKFGHIKGIGNINVFLNREIFAISCIYNRYRCFCFQIAANCNIIVLNNENIHSLSKKYDSADTYITMDFITFHKFKQKRSISMWMLLFILTCRFNKQFCLFQLLLYKLNYSHFSAVSASWANLENSCVSAVSLSVRGSNFVKQFYYYLFFCYKRKSLSF